MNTVRRFNYKLEQPIYGTSVGLSLQSNWRALPSFLHEVKRLDMSVHKAKYWSDWTTMYLKHSRLSSAEAISAIEGVLEKPISDDITPLYTSGLPLNTSICMYNISTTPFTILDFGCIDRPGLMCEVLELLSRYDIDVKYAYINTIGTVVSNIFYISYRGKKLTDDYISYIRNNMEFDIRNGGWDSY